MDNEKLLISVIVPVYNVPEELLRRCIDSIIGQSYKNIEIILVDDGSTNGCENICDAYAKADSRVNVIHKDNGGVSSARNTGINAALGDYIGFVDSDDWIEIDMYEILVSAALENCCDICCCGVSIDELSGKTVNYYGTHRIIKLDWNESMVAFLDDNLIGIGVWNKIFNAKLIKGKVCFDEGIVINEDKLFLFLALLNSSQGIYFKDDCKYHYIKRINSATTSVFSKDKLDSIKVNDIIEGKLSNIEFNDINIVKKNQLITYMLLYREITFSDNCDDFSSIRKDIKDKICVIYNKNISNIEINLFNRIELFFIRRLSLMYKVVFGLMFKLHVIKNIKNAVDKRKVSNKE